MILHNVGYDHRHDSDFCIERPAGSGDCLLLILKTDAIFTLNGTDIFVPQKSFFLYPKGMPQFYRCVRQQSFSNDWMHFLFEGDEEAQFLQKGIPYATPVPLDYTEFYSFCIKAIADENISDHLHKQESIQLYFRLICNKVSEQIQEHTHFERNSRHEMLLTVRNQIYANPFWAWSVDWASHQTRMSRSSFEHQYKEQFGVSFIQDLVTSRTEYAKMLLYTTDISIHDVAIRCGYQNYEHFARQFKAKCGISPGEFRKASR